MPVRFLDLTVALTNEVPANPPYLRPRIEYGDHDSGVAAMQQMSPGVRPDRRPDGTTRLPPLPNGQVVTAEKIDPELARIGYTVQPLGIVLAHRCGCPVRVRRPRRQRLRREATLHLTGMGRPRRRHGRVELGPADVHRRAAVRGNR
ncbi:MAG: cyclase [Naasia sp.]|nr:cyclase [Naasia sp.]